MLPRSVLGGLLSRASSMAALGSKALAPSRLLGKAFLQPRLARPCTALGGERPSASPFAAGRLLHSSPQLAAARGRPVTTGAAAVRAALTSVWLGRAAGLLLVFLGTGTLVSRLPSTGAWLPGLGRVCLGMCIGRGWCVAK